MRTLVVCLVAILIPVLAEAKAPTRAAEDNLTLEFAKHRRGQVKSVAYTLALKLEKGSEEFTGKLTADVELAKVDQPLSFDFMGKKVTSLEVNDKVVTDFSSRTGSFDIPAKYLAPKSRIEIEYVGAYNKDGDGFQTSTDPEDKSEYVFTDFEPYAAHYLFPCFDQPDLKATYTVQIDAPSDWKAISNELVDKAFKNGDRTLTTFKKTPPLSTYLLFVGAGPFVEWTDKHGATPIYLWARKSLAKYVDHERIMLATKKGLAFYDDYFGYPYPFSKYGQIFIPEFNHGGMENPGAIALNERNIHRGPVTRAELEERDNLILHEMAHMWFGDLVTMKWWNDLWLNESFASFMATLANDRAMGAKGTWLSAFSSKGWAYWQDQLPTTHPIETPVGDVRTAKGNFDGITYAKGEASLRQLHYNVGDAGFRDGVRSYFKRFAFANTVREDFVTEIASASKHDLKAWTKAWLQTAGPNRVEAKWACKDGKVSSFVIEQTPSSSKTLSPHRARVALFRSDANGALTEFAAEDVAYSEKTTPTKLVGQPCPDFVYPNSGDHDYALFALDPVSAKSARQVLMGGVQDPLLRLQVWGTLSQMVRDLKLPVREYLELALAGIPKETDEDVLDGVLGNYSSVRENFYRYLTPKERVALAPRLEGLVWERAAGAKAGSDTQMLFFDFYASIAETPGGIAKLKGFLNGQNVPAGLTVDQERRWKIVKFLVARGASDPEKLIDAEEKRDPSTSGKRHAYAALAAIATPEAKRDFWKSLEKPDAVPFSTLKMAAGHFSSWVRPELTEPYTKPYFDRLGTIDWAAHDELVEIYFEELFPQVNCTKSLLKESEARLRRAKRLTPIARRAWVEANYELAKCVAIRTGRRGSWSSRERTDQRSEQRAGLPSKTWWRSAMMKLAFSFSLVPSVEVVL